MADLEDNAEFQWDYGYAFDEGTYPGGWSPPAIGIWEPQLMAFRVFLANPKYPEFWSEYRQIVESYSHSLMGSITCWLMFGDGFLWCPTYVSYLEAIITIAANWVDDNDRQTVSHPHAAWTGMDDSEEELPPADVFPHKGPFAIVRLAPERRPDEPAYETGLNTLLNERNFERMREAHRIGYPRPPR